MLLQAVDEQRLSASARSRRDKQQRGHGLAAQGQGAQQLADRQQQDGDPQRGAVQCAGNGDDKGGQGNEDEDG